MKNKHLPLMLKLENSSGVCEAKTRRAQLTYWLLKISWLTLCHASNWMAFTLRDVNSTMSAYHI